MKTTTFNITVRFSLLELKRIYRINYCESKNYKVTKDDLNAWITSLVEADISVGDTIEEEDN